MLRHVCFADNFQCSVSGGLRQQEEQKLQQWQPKKLCAVGKLYKWSNIEKECKLPMVSLHCLLHSQVFDMLIRLRGLASVNSLVQKHENCMTTACFAAFKASPIDSKALLGAFT